MTTKAPEEPEVAGAAPENSQTDPLEAAKKMSWYIARLQPGPAAQLRRRPLAGGGSMSFWRLLARYRPKGAEERPEIWAKLIQAIAILTPTGRDGKKPPAHNADRALGEALAQAGVSELTLGQLLGAKANKRADLALRMCRRLVAAKIRRIDVRTLAAFVLYDSEKTCARIAREYFSYRVKAEIRASAQGPGPATEGTNKTGEASA